MNRTSAPTLITGGAGFIGSNLADRLLADGERVLIFDNLSRPGVEDNVRWLAERHGSRLEFVRGDVRDAVAVREAVAEAGSVFHFAAQVAVTTSLEDPSLDFDVNARGTFHVLDAVREMNPEAPLLFTSTNKVYGCLEELPLRLAGSRYVPEDAHIARRGLGECTPLDFASPYGCSKGAADQYVLDYAKSYDLAAVVFRMSCIYGPRQMGTEDQGWVAHFLRHALEGREITVYGDGCQVRDLLYVGDLVEAMLLARTHAPRLAGRAFNIGGGAQHTASIREVLGCVAEMIGREPDQSAGEWRRGDQRYYVSDVTRFREATGWSPRTSVRAGLERLGKWLHQRQEMLAGEVLTA